MEKLHDLLIRYNTSIPQESRTSWSKQFLAARFPEYWYRVYSLLMGIDRDSRVVEIGCGQADITSILCYLNFKNISAYERDGKLAHLAEEKLRSLFGKEGIVILSEFNNQTTTDADVLILVNCVYADGIHTKNEYLDRIISWYEAANKPRYLLLEFIDDSYIEEDEGFPKCVRLNAQDVRRIFPNSQIEVFPTYKYPINKKSKNLYFITTLS